MSECQERLRPATPVEFALLAAALLAGAWWRLREVGPAFFFGDELHALGDINGGLPRVLSTFSDTGSGMALPLMQLTLSELFGTGHWSMRAPAWLAGLALLCLTYPVARRVVGTRAAIVAGLLVAANPLLIFYSHFARSYALVALLCLLLLGCLQRTLAQPAQTRPPLAALVLLTALLPYVHPVSLGFVLPVFAGTILAMLSEAGRRKQAIRLTIALVLGGLLCLLLHLPAWSSLREFLEAKTGAAYYGDFGFWDVATLLAGGRWAAYLLLTAAVIAAVAHLRQRRWHALPLVLGSAGPGLTIALVDPYGDAYAYARYVMPCIPPVAMLLGEGLVRGTRRLVGDRPLGTAITLLAAAGVCAVLFLAGPNGPRRMPAGPYANTYLDILALPAFDALWPDAPSFYRELAARPARERAALRIIEAPALATRTRHLYRNYFLLHGIETLLAPFPGEFPRLLDGPYVSLRGRDWRARANADYLIVHLDVVSEALRYWDYVYNRALATVERADLAVYMERHSSFGGSWERPPAGLMQSLVAELGEPIQADERIVVWRLE